MEINNYEEIIADLKTINAYKNKYKVPNQIFQKINRQIYKLTQELASIVNLKIIGDYKNNLIFNFHEIIKIEAIGLKRTSFKKFQFYENQINEPITEKVDEINLLQQQIIKKISTAQFEDDIEIKTKGYLNSDKKEIIELVWKVENTRVQMEIVVGFDNNKIYQIIKKRGTYKISFDLKLTKEYQILNKLLFKKLDFLFLSFYQYKGRKISSEEIRILKIAIISKIQTDLHKDDNMKKWISLVYKKFLRNEIFTDNLFRKNDFLFKNSKTFNQVYQAFKINRLSFVFNSTYTNFKRFISDFTNYAQEVIKSYENSSIEKDFAFFHLYDINPYLTSKGLNKNILIRNWQKINEESNLKLSKKYIYPDNKDIGTFMLFTIFYKFEIE
ncbi:hypothetical protein SSABA_v1c05680 [Spiroplasma sabaudiense Ar-1343]|uniref:Uncharacterized protein n=1 Tax=Spiroplasma sabaudiense Ar-1343 TaxID=1276257 RepID=W6AA79_9MOLU|nr:hypothetical protein [Spiroplasma sabaudiense]AHI53972.1 hypothetical protein SSABA_v1c05680 [Spiroplasma sabaudiense Ar-1343]